MDERLAAIEAEFRRHDCEFVVLPSARGERRGGWLARYRCPGCRALDGVAHGNTALEAAELALAQLRSRRNRR